MKRRTPMTLVLEQNWRFDLRASVAEAQERVKPAVKTAPKSGQPVIEKRAA